jgi:hypothetical protein
MLSPAAPPVTVEAIAGPMMRAEGERMAAFSGHTGMCRYRVESRKVKKRAEVTVRATGDPAGATTFDVVTEGGSKLVRSHIVRQTIEAERQANAKEEHEQTRTLPQEL